MTHDEDLSVVLDNLFRHAKGGAGFGAGGLAVLEELHVGTGQRGTHDLIDAPE